MSNNFCQLSNMFNLLQRKEPFNSNMTMRQSGLVLQDNSVVRHCEAQSYRHLHCITYPGHHKWSTESKTWTCEVMKILFEYSTRYLMSEILSWNWDPWEILYLQATMYFFGYYMNILLTRRSQLYSCFKKGMGYHSFMALNRATDMSADDWLSLTRTKLSHFFMSGDTLFSQW